jgi:hypothetical protein
MSIRAAWPRVHDFFGTPLVIEPSPGQLSSDEALLPIRQFDWRIGSPGHSRAPSTTRATPT